MITACYRLQYMNLHRIEFLLFHERFDSSFNQDLIIIETYISPILIKTNYIILYQSFIFIRFKSICFLFLLTFYFFQYSSLFISHYYYLAYDTLDPIPT